ncbi:MAG TPA: diacylglycerol kinase family protein [Planctomycetota bacterium]|nr:diacylglycerol kinase family protein [Planctomycetota bacterium]
MLADVLAPRRTSDKTREPAAPRPSAAFDLAAADALELGRPATRPSRLIVFANPKAGDGQADEVLGRISQLLRIEKITLDVRPSSDAEELAIAARGAKLKGLDGVLVLGGDGTINAVVHGLLSRPAADQPLPPLALVPVGKGNALATELGVTDVVTAVARLLAGETRPLDAIEITSGERSFHALTVVGWGLDADVTERAQNWKVLGSRSYGVALRLETVRNRPRYARIEVQFASLAEEMVQGPYTMLLMANTRHTGNGLLVAPRARLDDGLMDLVEVLPVGLGKRIATLRSLQDGSHLDSPAVRWRHVRGVTLYQPSLDELFGANGSNGGGKAKPPQPQQQAPAPEPLRLNIDGDLVDLPHDAEVKLTVLPRALRVFAPKSEDSKSAKG